jgi:hypothetical protein
MSRQQKKRKKRKLQKQQAGRAKCRERKLPAFGSTI